MKGKKILSILLIMFILVSPVLTTASQTVEEPKMKTLQVNQTTLNFQEVVYVDGLAGSDDMGDGTKENPFASVISAVDHLAKHCLEGGAVVIKDGTYETGSLFTSTAEKYNGMKLSLFAETMGKVTLVSTEVPLMEAQDSPQVIVKVYGAVLEGNPIYGYLGSEDINNEYYNCVFPNGYGAGQAKAENSIFTGISQTSLHPATGSAINCASTIDTMDPINGTILNGIYNVEIDQAYHITSEGWEHKGIGMNPDGTQAHIGVYGGQFAWGSTIVEALTADKYQIVMELNEVMHLKMNKWLPEGAVVTWTSFNSDIVTVTTGGVAKAVSLGSATVEARDETSGYIEYISILVVQDAKDLRLAVDLNIGESCRLTVDNMKNRAAVMWFSNNPDIINVSYGGKVTALKEGLSFVTANNVLGNELVRIYIRTR